MGGWDAVAASVSGVNPSAYGFQGGPMYRPVLKPTEYTDDTLMTVPVLDPEILRGRRDGLKDEGALGVHSKKEGNFGGRPGLFRHNPSSSQSSSHGKVNVSIRQVTRTEYLKHYAKDELGRYVGTEDPAEDCILNGEDSSRWRGREAGSGMAAGEGESTSAEGGQLGQTEMVDVAQDEAVGKGNRPGRPSKREEKSSTGGNGAVEVDGAYIVPDPVGAPMRVVNGGRNKSRFSLFKGLRGGDGGGGVIR
ncbi:uncharacterized protein Z520_09229 [Fonsecaea multimorphosa CBS 102226]|uniref:Uncharacterized protein n=1 Tax=Fonsecaea multimorphosa CBS 102226 TaxID=1442371 RepID=A0A0D2JWR6_9EURO|nr:uncharacterized protein Z520_09229 [Fonsecaea multimorphosa CBS 102226]KIX94919.1 hypothetical protein Z520_09229 [Fonsecaea multimorphosa CBS 102226]OAL20570.1 hypothetical protein AYO22_08579 [Fonsecaea multimorphosa]